jgi:hypothetical protein
MKKNKMSFVIVGVIFFSLSFVSIGNTQSSDRWIQYGSSKYGDHFYDKSSMIKVSSKIIKVWIKIQLSKVGKDFSIQVIKDYIKSIDGYEKLDYTIILYELDCLNNTTKQLKLVDYDNEGKSLENIDFTDPKIKQIIPESMDEGLLKTICK